MIVVSNTTPLNYLVLIDAVDVLGKLFDEVRTPRAVIQELSHPKAPPAVRAWAAAPPVWLNAIDVTQNLPSTDRLDPGEAQAISLAKSAGITEILLDDRRGTQIAAKEGLHPIHTLAILEAAAHRNFIDLRLAIDRLRQTTIRIAPRYYIAALARHAARQGG